MRDMSVNLTSQAYYLGYRLEGDLGTIGNLYLYKDGQTVATWFYPKRAPDIFEMEDVIGNLEREMCED